MTWSGSDDVTPTTRIATVINSLLPSERRVVELILADLANRHIDHLAVGVGLPVRQHAPARNEIKQALRGLAFAENHRPWLEAQHLERPGYQQELVFRQPFKQQHALDL